MFSWRKLFRIKNACSRWGKKGLINKVKSLGLSHKSLARCMECSTRCPNVSIVKINVLWDIEDTNLNHSPKHTVNQELSRLPITSIRSEKVPEKVLRGIGHWGPEGPYRKEEYDSWPWKLLWGPESPVRSTWVVVLPFFALAGPKSWTTTSASCH